MLPTPRHTHRSKHFRLRKRLPLERCFFFPRFVKLMSNRDLQALPGFVLAAAMRCAAGIVAGCRARGRQDPGPDAGEEDRL